MATRYDILGIGNAIVDVVGRVDDAFLSRHAMHKGAMRLIDAATADRLYAAMPGAAETSGGSVANTCAVAALLGSRVYFLGTVADDGLGASFRRDITAAGVDFPSAPLAGASPTARCLIAVTPDGQRTMNTYLGACVAFDEHSVDTARVADSAVTYLEGYLFDPPAAQAAFQRAAQAARGAGRLVALSLSDAFCVDRHRDAFRALIAAHVDILFANEAEAASLFERNDWNDVVAAARAAVPLVAITRSADGSTVLRGAETIDVPAAQAALVDSTGAGDAYAAGFLHAYVGGGSLRDCAMLGGEVAAAVIEQVGARPAGDGRARVLRAGGR